LTEHPLVLFLPCISPSTFSSSCLGCHPMQEALSMLVVEAKELEEVVVLEDVLAF
jgi:hypothetical protein